MFHKFNQPLKEMPSLEMSDGIIPIHSNSVQIKDSLCKWNQQIKIYIMKTFLAFSGLLLNNDTGSSCIHLRTTKNSMHIL